MMKKAVGFLMIIMMLSFLNITTEAIDLPLRVVVDNEELEFPDAQPFIDENDRTQIPARFVGEGLGAEVSWNQELQAATFEKGSNVLVFTINSEYYSLNGRTLKMDTAAIISEDRTYVPVRYVAEAFGAEVGWNEATWTVSVTSGELTVITTGGDDVQYYDGVAFNGDTDIDIYGYMTEEKTLEFCIAATDNFKFVSEDGVLYCEGEYPEAPEGFTWFVKFNTLRYDIIPVYRYTDAGNDMYYLPSEGYFKAEMYEQDRSKISGYEIVLKLFNDNQSYPGYFLAINSKVNFDDSAEYIQQSGRYSYDIKNQINYNGMFEWE